MSWTQLPYKNNKGGFPINLGPNGSLLGVLEHTNELSVTIIASWYILTPVLGSV